MTRYNKERAFLKSNFDGFNKDETDRAKGLPKPFSNKPYGKECTIIKLPDVNPAIAKKGMYDSIKDRRSTRLYSEENISLEELSYLLWATQGITRTTKSGLTLRTVPCSGATHSFESYLIIMGVEGLDQGVYRYEPIEHNLLFIAQVGKMGDQVDDITLDQPFVQNFAKKAAVLFAWSTIPYRSEWKFDTTAHKKILIDIGHVCQNLYLASESVDLGACAIGIYDQEKVDLLLEIDGEEEFVIYMAAVGKKRESKERRYE